MEQKNSWFERIILVLTTAIITFLLTVVVIEDRSLKSNGLDDNQNSIGSLFSQMFNNNNEEVTSKNSLLSEIKEKLNRKYVDPDGIDEDKLIEGAAAGMVEALGDEYTVFVSKSDASEYETAILGAFDGIGVYIGADTTTNQIIVIAPIEDSPAAKAGILPNDVILKVDDVEYDASTMETAVSKIKGTVGTKVKLTIKRNEEVKDIEVERANIKLTHIKTEVLKNNIGYVEISSFDEGCSEEFEEKVTKLIEEEKVESLIIDLRNNPGGILDEVIKIADFILPEGKIVSIKDNTKKEVVYKSSDTKSLDLPIVVLVNANSASASEILAGAIQDNEKGKIIGNVTFGKGTVQEIMKLSNGGLLKVTTSKYYTPNGTEINHVGVKPDIEVSLPDEYKNSLEVPQDKDTQLKKAIEEIKNMKN